MVESLQSICVNTAYACAAGVGVAVVAYVVTRGMKFLSGGVKCVTAVSLVGSLIFGGMVVTNTRYAAAKTNDTQQVGGDLSNTNDVGQVEGGTNVLRGVVQGRARSPSAPQGVANGESNGPALRRVRGTRPTGTSPVTDEDISNQWRVVSVGSNVLAAATFTMPEGATVWEDARDFGAGWGSWKIPFGGWRFTYGDIGWTNGFAWVEGYFRSKFRSRANEIRLLSERLALCPAANWSRYNLAASRAWCATNDVDGLVVTFENAAIGDDPTKIASVQMELFPRTGEVALRYDLSNVGDAIYTAGLVVNGTNHFVEIGAGTREVIFQRVHPDDWDMDGLPNSLDDNPRVPSMNARCNQNDEWAILTFPSDAAEIASVGYAAWAMARATDPNRRLVGLRVSSASGAWPLLLTFGDWQVMCDGNEELVFAIDCGAHYPFSISDGGELEFVTLHADGDDIQPCFAYGYPYERWAGDVVAHLDSPSSGWIGRTAEVSVDGLDDSHFFPNGSETVTAVVTNCHEDTYIDCTWSGGEGFSFADAHSLSTTVNWNGDEAWATNYVTCVTTYEGGYAVTNSQAVTVGGSDTPPLRLSMTGQDVYFLNDYDNGNRTERVYRVSFELQGPHDTTGNLSVESVGGAEMKFFFEKGLLGPATNSIPMSIGEDGYFCTTNLYLACPELGRGRVVASFRSDGGGTVSTSRTCRVIEPLRRLVTNETCPNSRQYVNPSCLVYGTNAVLRVDVRTGIGGEFGSDEMNWVWISGPCSCVTNGWYLEVTPTATNGEVKIEARFNEDEIQPRFVLPIVMPKTVNIRAYLVDPPEGRDDLGWDAEDVTNRVSVANEIFAQAGIKFNLLSVEQAVAMTTDWVVRDREIEVDGNGRTNKVVSAQTRRLFSANHSDDAVDVIFTGAIEDHRVVGFKCDFGVVLGKQGRGRALAHELGHILTLKDCFDRIGEGVGSKEIFGGENDLIPQFFDGGGQDWGLESRRGFYGLENDLPNVLGTFLMYGWKGDWRVDIPMFRVTGLPEGAGSEWRTDKIKVGAHYIDFRAIKGEGSREK